MTAGRLLFNFQLLHAKALAGLCYENFIVRAATVQTKGFYEQYEEARGWGRHKLWLDDRTSVDVRFTSESGHR
jgi:hypothetical protein